MAGRGRHRGGRRTVTRSSRSTGRTGGPFGRPSPRSATPPGYERRSIVSSSLGSSRGAATLRRSRFETLIRRVSLDLIGLPPTPAGGGRGLADAGQRGVDAAYETRRRPAARLAALRRALGAPLARPRPLRRLATAYEKDLPARDLEVPRLGHRRAQPRHAVRSVHDRADCRRHAAERRRPSSRSPPASIATR